MSYPDTSTSGGPRRMLPTLLEAVGLPHSAITSVWHTPSAGRLPDVGATSASKSALDSQANISISRLRLGPKGDLRVVHVL